MDFLATKGIEYLLVIGYLLLLVPFWIVLQRPAKRLATAAAAAPVPARERARSGWFALPANLLFHRGHAWALPEGNGVFRVGIDDFARKLVGALDAIELPKVGSQLAEGVRGWRLGAAGRSVGMLAAVTGEVTEVNDEVVRNPRLAADDPYGRGWLLKVRAPRAAAALRNLLPANLAEFWTGQETARLMGLMTPQLGTVLQDGGVPVDGIARELDREDWTRVAAVLLLTADDAD